MSYIEALVDIICDFDESVIERIYYYLKLYFDRKKYFKKLEPQNKNKKIKFPG